jgi:hypothetical protein
MRRNNATKQIMLHEKVQKYLQKPLHYNATSAMLFSATRQNSLKLH